MEMLQHVWWLGEATVADVHERVLAEREIAYTTVMSILKKLSDKGYLTYSKEGNAYVYSPDIPPDEVRASVLREITDKVFASSPVSVMQTLVRQEDLSAEEREEILRMIERLGRNREK